MSESVQLVDSPAEKQPVRKFQFYTLDAMRGIAILMVILCHLVDRGKNSGDKLIFERISPILSHGYLGVQLFFVISGYCILAAAYALENKSRAERTFITRRCRRIYPPFWLSMILTVVLGFLTVFVLRKNINEILVLTPLDWFLTTLLIQQPFQANDSTNMVYWSLSIEIQFYLTVLIGLFLRRFFKAGIELSMILFSIAALMSFIWQQKISGTVINYWQQFACGIFAFYILTRCHRWAFTPWIILATIIASLVVDYMYYQTLFYESKGHVSVAVKIAFSLFCMLVMLLVYRYDEKLHRSVWLKPLTFSGIISYSLYLTHVPICTRVSNLGEKLTTLNGLNWFLYFLLSIVAAYVSGYIFHILCEKPFMNKAKN